jgi:hypothetical protein
MKSGAAVLSPIRATSDLKETFAKKGETQRTMKDPLEREDPLPLTALADIFKIMKSEGTL